MDRKNPRCVLMSTRRQSNPRPLRCPVISPPPCRRANKYLLAVPLCTPSRRLLGDEPGAGGASVPSKPPVRFFAQCELERPSSRDRCQSHSGRKATQGEKFVTKSVSPISRDTLMNTQVAKLSAIAKGATVLHDCRFWRRKRRHAARHRRTSALGHARRLERVTGVDTQSSSMIG